MTKIFVTGLTEKPKTLSTLKEATIELVPNPYDLRDKLQEKGEKILLVYLPFLELRHFELYRYFQKTYEQVQTIFVVQELSSSMKLKVKANKEFIVLWKTEEPHLPKIIRKFLQGEHPLVRQDRREHHPAKGLISPSALPRGNKEQKFQAMLPGNFQNLSFNGSCLRIKNRFYQPKDFVHLSFQGKDGEFVSIEGQVRWSRWNPIEQIQEIGLRFVTTSSG